MTSSTDLTVDGGGDMASRANPSAALHGATSDAEPSALVTVETAAIRIGEAVFTLPRPNRHHNVMWWLSVLGVPSWQMHDQGFVLSNGCFVDRKSAAHFANLAGQFDRLTAPPNLYSEDLWDGGADMPRPDQIKALAIGASSRSLDVPQEDQND